MDYIELGQGKLVIVCKSVYPILANYGWHLHVPSDGISPSTIRTKVNGKYITMPNFIMNPRKDELVEHKNGNVLDCIYNNLVIVKQVRKTRKDSVLGIKGVQHRINKWVVYYYKDGKQHYGGSYICPLMAQINYKKLVAEQQQPGNVLDNLLGDTKL